MDIQDLTLRQKEFDESYERLKRWTRTIDQDNLDVLEFLALALAGEVGEACNLVKKVIRGDHPLEEAREEIVEELIDAFIYLLKLFSQLEVDVEEEYEKKQKKNAVKFGSGQND